MDDVRIEAAAKSLHGFSLSILPLEEAPGTYRREQMRRAEAMLDAADAVDPLRNPRLITTDGEFDALPADARIWGSSHRRPGVAGSGSPYVKLEDGMWWDFGNDYAVGSDDIMRPAVVVYRPTEAP